MRLHHTSKRSVGFSLVELLIVIGIIAVLVSILLPALNRAREMAKRAQCLSNVRQLSMAWIMYANEHKGRISPSYEQQLFGVGGFLPHGQRNGICWLAATTFSQAPPDVTTGQLWPYLRSKSVYICPADPQERHLIDDPQPMSLTGGRNYDYGMNSLLGNGTIVNGRLFDNGFTITQTAVIVTLGQIKHPERMALFLERGDFIGGGGPACPLPVYGPQGITGGFYFGKLHRNGNSPAGCTVSFVDGHAMFWSYTGDIAREDAFSGGLAGTDIYQLAAWNGVGQIPPE